MAALDELPSVRQTIGKLGYQLRRCKPGTKRHKEIWDALTRLENEVCALSSKIRMALHFLVETDRPSGVIST